jgi:transcriptional regulator with AAA-type ATPase domain
MAPEWTNERVNSRLLEVAREYTNKGYKVAVRPRGLSLPQFLRDFEPDIVAEKQGDRVVIEVKSQESLRKTSKITSLASAIETQPKWRLELVVTNPRRGLDVETATVILSSNEIVERLQSAEKLLEIGQLTAAFLFAWIVLEAKMRRILQLERRASEEMSSIGTLKTVYSLGHIDRDGYDFLSSCYNKRSQFLHGFEVGGVESAVVKKLLQVAESIDKPIDLFEDKPIREPDELKRVFGEEIYNFITRVSATGSIILIRGESGTRKDLIAQAIHDNGPNGSYPFVYVSCEAIPESLLDSHFFGYVHGAFTGAVANRLGLFEQADKGTIFLAEIETLPLNFQAKLLKVLAEGRFIPVGGTDPITVDVRLIAATDRDLEAIVEAGRFRQDLYYRLNVFPIYVEPLRNRRGDLPSLIEFFLRRKAQYYSTPEKVLSGELFNFLVTYSWPGNIRQLENVIEQFYLASRHTMLTLEDLPEGMLKQARVQPGVDATQPLTDAVADYERKLILRALERAGFNRAKAATLLRTTTEYLSDRLEKLGIRHLRN